MIINCIVFLHMVFFLNLHLWGSHQLHSKNTTFLVLKILLIHSLLLHAAALQFNTHSLSLYDQIIHVNLLVTTPFHSWLNLFLHSFPSPLLPTFLNNQFPLCILYCFPWHTQLSNEGRSMIFKQTFMCCNWSYINHKIIYWLFFAIFK